MTKKNALMTETSKLDADTCQSLVVAKLVRTILDAGCNITVNDGEEVAISRSTDYDAIIAAMFSTDSDTLIVRDPHALKPRLGVILLVYGNGRDVISDNTDNEAINALVQAAAAYAEKLPA